MDRAHRIFLTTLAALAAGLVAAASAGAESAVPGLSGLTRVEIRAHDLTPERVRLGEGGSFVLANTAPATARVEFRLPRGEGLECVDGRGDTARGRKFVIDRGDTLACRSDRARIDYSVYRNVRLASGAFEPRRSDGRLDRR